MRNAHTLDNYLKNNNNSRSEEILAKIQDISVLVIGDIMLDKFIYGRVERISPEAPIPVLSVSREDSMPGGAGNTLASVAGLGAKTKIVATIGHDDNATILKDKMRAVTGDDSGLIVTKNRPTTVKSRFLAGHQQMLRADLENKSAIDDATAKAIIAQAEHAIASSHAVILSDYDKGVLRSDVIFAVIQAAKARGIPVIVDPKGQDYSIYKGASAVTPNKKELSDATRGADVSSDDSVVKAASSLIKDCDIDAVVATRSKDGMSVVQSDQDPVHLRTVDIEVFDVSGAGDVVIATIASALGAGATLVEAAGLANIAGGIAVSKVGTTPIRADELLDAVRADDSALHERAASGLNAEQPTTERTRQAGLYSWDEAQEQVARWKARGLKVGLTNGCFDILHYGHVNYLNQARAKCDRLIVALNKDSSVRVLKGEERPVHDEDSRASVLGALGSVDMVTLFGANEHGDDNTANEIIERLKPDIYFKGGDYTVDQIPETPGVMAYGGVVDVMPVYDGHSTTSSIAKMRA